MYNILCIDDIESNLFTLKSLLESYKQEAYHVITANSAHAGLDVLLKKKIDLILLDVMMPDIDGFACAKMIRSNRKTKKIPIIFVTAKTDDNTISRCFDIGGNDYITKPFNSTELLARISFHIRLGVESQLLKDEKEYTQNILDLQDNMILVTDGKEPTNANKALLEFYGFEDLATFIEVYNCVCSTFIHENGYFSLKMLDEGSFWIDDIIKLSSHENVLVKIKGVSRDAIFAIKVASFNDYFIVTLTDITKISNLSDEFEHAANFDALTEIYNRNMLHKLMDKKIYNQKEHREDFIFIMLDIDFFKKVNDTHGHLVGDSVLKGVVSIIKKHIRSEDIFARWGGEEFVLVLNVDSKKGLSIAENLRVVIKDANFDKVKNITCSFGVTFFQEKDTLDNLIHRADKALYKAKTEGRDRVCLI